MCVPHFISSRGLHITTPPPLSDDGQKRVTRQTSAQPVHTLKCSWNHRTNGTAEHCCICISGRACVERFVDLLAAPPVLPHPLSFPQGWWFGMMPWCDDLVCSWRRLLADRHSLPFPWTLSLHRQWCPSASHHPVTFLFLPALTVPLPCPFLSFGLSLRRPRCPSASHHSFPSHSLGRLCQRSPRTCPVSLLCDESPQRKANAFARGGGASLGQHKNFCYSSLCCCVGDCVVRH